MYTKALPTYNTLTEEDSIELWAMLSLQCTTSFSNALIKRLLTYYSTAHKAIEDLSSNPFAWEAIGIRRDIISTYIKHAWKTKAQYIWSTIQNNPNVSLLLYSNSMYPPLLRNIIDPPPILYCLGNTTLLTSPSIAVVGTRKSSLNGNEFSYRLSEELSMLGLTIISGLAEGIDSQAHQGTLDTGGNTIAVLGNGIDTVYPAKNKSLSRRIEEKGCLITEFHPSIPPKPAHFPIRNRIVSGLSLGVLVIEATIHSGTLTTVRTALEQGKNIYVVPTQYTSEFSTGSTYLLEEGATAVCTAKEIFEDILPQMTDTTISPAIRKKLLEYHLNLDIEEKDHYNTFLDSFPALERKIVRNISSTQENTPPLLEKEKTPKKYQETITKVTSNTIEYGISQIAEELLSFLHTAESSIETLVEKTPYTASQISSELIMLEIQGLIQKKAGGHYGIFYE